MIRKELGANFGRIILDLGLRDEGHWAQNVEGYMRELPNLGSMSETAPILIQLKQWCEKKWVSVSQFKTVTETQGSQTRLTRLPRLRAVKQN